MTYATLISEKAQSLSLTHTHTYTQLVSVLTLRRGRSGAALFPRRRRRAGRRAVAGVLLRGATNRAAARALASTLGAATPTGRTGTGAAPAAGTTPATTVERRETG